jgi:Raf kinase inhibitor-like YbhB/YbcL family protein
MGVAGGFVASMRHRMETVLGGPARTRVVVLLAGVLALSSADLGTIGAVARQLQVNLGLNHTELGLLATVSSGVGAIATVPMGALADRVPRVRLLALTIVVWSVALGFGGAATTFEWLLLSRLALGGATAAAGPLLASLMGDLFPMGERARVYGFVLTGEMIGAGGGLLVGGNIAAALSWRYAFWLLGLVGLGLAVAVHRGLPEPIRGSARAGGGLATPQSLWAAYRYIFKIRTIRILIIASAVGYFFFAGLRTFAVIFIMLYFGIGTGGASWLFIAIGAAALAGTVLGGRLADSLLARGHQQARIVVPAVAYSSVAILFVPGLLTRSVFVALPFFLMAAAMLAAANPPLDAARLDLVPPTLWGRAESARTVLRLAAEAVGPLCFGVVADLLGAVSGRAAEGLRDGFLIMLVPLLANGLIVLAGRRSYVPDVRRAQAMAPRLPSRASGIGPAGGDIAMAGIQLRSPAFGDHETIPRRHAHDSGNVSPALQWSGIPEGTSELLLLCEDPDAPTGTFLHWLVSGIDPSAAGTDEGQPPPGGQTWGNDFGEKGWGGPQPPVGDRAHRYFFRLYALREPVRLPAEPTAAEVHRAVDDAALASGTTVGLYQR